MSALFILLALIALFYALASAYMYRAIFAREPRVPMPRPVNPAAMSPWSRYDAEIEAGIRWFDGQNPVPVEIVSRDGLRLCGRYLEQPGAQDTIVLAHGYRSRGERDFACAFEMYHKLGLNLLVISQRAHGASAGDVIGFGALERFDVCAWVDFLNRRARPRKIILDGISMGATTVLMALDMALPDNVAGAIADCGFTSPLDILRYVVKTDYHLPTWMLPGTLWLFRLKTGVSLGEASALRSLSRARVPVLFLHGEDDRFVPCGMGRANYAACASEKALVTVPGAGHGVSFMVDREKCTLALDKFLNRVLQ